MADTMNHIERDVAALSNKPADRLPTYPLAMGVCRRLLNNNAGITYHEWVTDPKKFADAFVAGQRYFDFDFAIGLMDLSVMAGDLGAHVRMDEQNTPFVDEPVIKTVEDYEKLQVPNIKDPKTRSHVLVEGTGMFVKALGSEVITAAFLEGPLLALTQSRGAEFVFKDMYDNESSRAAVHKALKTITDYDIEMVKAFAEKKPAGLVWDYLWGSYSCLGDVEYDEFEGQQKYAGCLNDLVVKEGMANCVHNCADLPHLDTQVKAWKPLGQGSHRQGLRRQHPAGRQHRPSGLCPLVPREDAEGHHEPVHRGRHRSEGAWPRRQILHRFWMRGPARSDHKDGQHQDLRGHRQAVRYLRLMPRRRGNFPNPFLFTFFYR